jgi:hypothetical protein
MASKQRFCSTKHRVYASREGLYADRADNKPGSEADGDHSIEAALRAAHAFTPVPVGDTKTVAAIRVQRRRADPSSWEVSMPSASHLAAGKIHQALIEHVGDLLMLANKLGSAIDEPLQHLRTSRSRSR